MKRVTILGCSLLLAAWGLMASAQQQKKDKGKAAAAVPPTLPAYLGMGTFTVTEGAVPKRKLDSLLHQGLTAKDSAGNDVTVEGFNFTYIEHNIYEDSVGNPIPTTDYLNEYCIGNQFSATIQNLLPARTKAGDSVLIDRIKLRLGNGEERSGKELRLAITR